MKGIIMSGDSVPGVLAGTKTQSRRTGGLEAVNEEPDRWYFAGWGDDGAAEFCDGNRLKRCKPRYQSGETVYVKEAWQAVVYDDLGWRNSDGYEMDIQLVEYNKPLNPAYSGTRFLIAHRAGFNGSEMLKWRSPLFMPQWASRAYIRIPGVRCERLHDISEADARAEGCESVAHFARRWDEVNGRRYPWTGNWWVWVYGFQLLT